MMSEPQRIPTLDYSTPSRPGRAARQRTNYCVGLPLIGFGFGTALAHGGDQLFVAVVIAVGAFFLAMALPVQD